MPVEGCVPGGRLPRPQRQRLDPSTGCCAAAQVNGMLLEGKKVFVGPFLKRTERPADKELHYTNVFVKNLAETVTEETLDKLFSEYGTVRAPPLPARCPRCPVPTVLAASM